MSKPCLNCKQSFSPRPKESPKEFERRRFCCLTCAYAYARGRLYYGVRDDKNKAHA